MHSKLVVSSVALLVLLTSSIATAATYSLSTIVSFDGANGANPFSGLTFDANGNLYGTTLTGGDHGFGTVFKINAGTRTLTTLHSFSGPDGANPEGTLIVDADGNLFGTTSTQGPLGNNGTLFKIAAGTNSLTTLHAFSDTDGSQPHAGLVSNGSGNLYGTTTEGGVYDQGTIFQISTTTQALTTLHSFNGSDGSTPLSGVAFDANGNLYGTTEYGGISNLGTVFQLSSANQVLTTLHSFSGSDGNGPSGPIVGADGNLYGITAVGGANGVGTVWSIVMNANSLTTLHAFNGIDGINPYSGLTLNENGDLFGVTTDGGEYGAGTVFKIASGTNMLTTLYSFNGSDGSLPYGGLTFDKNGNLYGTTYFGGTEGVGTLFELRVVPESSSLVLTSAVGFCLLWLGCRSRFTRH